MLSSLHRQTNRALVLARLLLAVISIFGMYSVTNHVALAATCTDVAMRCVGSGQEYTTIQSAVTAAQAGDTVVVYAGTYAGFATARSGTSGNPITITSNGSDVVTINAQVRVDHNYITLNGLTINYTDSYEGGASLRVGYSSQLNHITVTNCRFSANGPNAFIAIFYADDVLFDGNIVEGPKYFIGLVQSGQRQTVSNNIFRNTTDVERIFNVAASNSVWRGNEIYNFNWTGTPSVHPDIWQTINDGSIAQHNIIENNYVHDLTDVQTGAIETNSTGTNVNDWTWRNNVFANAGTLYLISGNFKFYNNTYYRTGATNQSAILIYQDAFGDGSGADFKNNIFLQETNQGIIGTGGGNPTYTYSYNFVANTNYTARSGWSETGGVNGGNPQFTTASTNCISTTCDFHIATTSAAKDKGTSIGSVTVDKDGIARPQGTAYDMGAYEYTSATTSDVTPPTVSLTAPTNSTTVSGSSVTLSANASDNVGVAGVTFKVDGTTIGGEDTSAPYSVTWDSTATSSGSKTILAIARDTSNNYATSSVITVTVDNSSPTISPIVLTQAGGGSCSNCGGIRKSTGNTSADSESSQTSATTTPVTTILDNATASTTGFMCTIAGENTSDFSTAGLINLFVSLGIIPREKAQKACDALVSVQPSVTASVVKKFTTPLKPGSRGNDVYTLQVFLNTHGFIIAANGSGSPGNETDFYGTLTVAAVKRFQAVYKAEILTPVGLISPSGFFGLSSMKKGNQIIESLNRK